MKHLKNIKARTKNYVKVHETEIVLLTCEVVLGVGYVYFADKLAKERNYNRQITRIYNDLFDGVVMNHKFEYDAETKILWDLNINPNKV